MPTRLSAGDQRGQATPEYVAVVLLLAAALAATIAVTGGAVPAGELARSIAAKLICAVRPGGSCDRALAAEPTALQRTYGPAVAAMLSERAPEISFERADFVSLPVDYRECRQRSCADSIRHGALSETQTGLRPTAFTHVVDCRSTVAEAPAGYDCSGARAGNVYLQYWFYYPDSLTQGLGMVGGYHTDDWESYQVRVDPSSSEALARASSHRGYNGRSGGDIKSDTGWFGGGDGGWDTILGQLHVASGSHAGMSQANPTDDRRVEPQALRLIPLEPIARDPEGPDFSITPPWEKGVWNDPESTGT